MDGIKSIYFDSLACVKVKEGESEGFRIDGGVKQGFIISPWLFNVYMDAVMNEVKMGMRRRGVRFLERGENGLMISFKQITWYCVVSQRRT